MAGAFSCSSEYCGNIRDFNHPRKVCVPCDAEERRVYLLDVLEMAVELTDGPKWPGLAANLKDAISLLKGNTKFVNAETISELHRLGKFKGTRIR